MHVGDLAGAGHLPTVSMVVRVANRANFDTPSILFFNWLKAERTTVFHCTRKPDTCASHLWCVNFRFTGANLDRFLQRYYSYARSVEQVVCLI